MDSDKSLTLADRSLSNIAGYDRTWHKLITNATNRANIHRIVLIRFYFLSQTVDGLGDAAVKIFVCLPHPFKI